jgi:hypothetical protein
MGERYDAYFDRRASAFSRERLAARVGHAEDAQRIVLGAIQSAEIPYPLQVKPDARFFLELCVQEMALGPTADVDPASLVSLAYEELPDDLVAILHEAARRTAAANDTDISAHSVLEAVVEIWPRLAFTSPLHWEL